MTAATRIKSYRNPQYLCSVATLAVAVLGVHAIAAASEFSVTPIRAELKPGAMSETFTVINESSTRLRVSAKVMAWTQDESGKDVYQESGELIYFPREMDVEPGAKRLVRVGAKNPAGTSERAYRLFIEELPNPLQPGAPAAVTFYFRFGAPIFLPPAVPKPQPEVMEPTLQKGKLSLVVRNAGNQHFRVIRLTLKDGGEYSQEIAGWYSLAGTSRSYTADIPLDVCRRAKVLGVKLEGDGFSFDRKLNVDPADCS